MYVLQPHLNTLRSPSHSIFVESNACPFSLWASPPLSFRVFSLRCSHGTRPRSTRKMRSQLEMNGFDSGRVDAMEDENDLSWLGGGVGSRRDGEKDCDSDRDPELAEIIGSSLDDPAMARSKMEERLRKKKDKILHTKVGSPNPTKVMFDKFEFSNSYIWFEFYNTPLQKVVSLICDLSQSPMEKRPSYDAIQGGNVTPTTFYNIGDLEIQYNLTRIWLDIGTAEPLLLDILINALMQVSSES